MKLLRFFGVLVGTLLVFILVAGAFLTKDFNFSKSIQIQASDSVVWQHMAVLKNHDKWSQWRKMDPNMQVTYTGTDGAAGSAMHWKSAHKDVGNGTESVVSVVPFKRVDFALDFDGRGTADAFMDMHNNGQGCTVNWGIHMKAVYPLNTIMYVLMNGTAMNKMLEDGLMLLKLACEQR